MDEEFELYKKVCDILLESGSYEELQRLTFSAMGSPVFAKSGAIKAECEFLCLLGRCWVEFSRVPNIF